MGTKLKTLVIAEAGVNHNGSIEMALQLIDAAAAAGADVVKFQSFHADKLVAPHASKAEYQKQSTSSDESQLEMIRKLEIAEVEYAGLIAHAKTNGIEFLSTPFDSESLEMLTGRFGLTTVKVSSGDITNAPFLLEIARKARHIIISTGMCTLAEVEAALGVLAFGLVADPEKIPSKGDFEAAYVSDAGQSALRGHVSVLHCTTEYPAPTDEVNLRAVDTIAAAFGLRSGYSDHTRGIHIPVAAVARGATIIEKHFTLDRGLPGPDHSASLEPGELAQMVSCIRDVERSLGDGIKRPTPSEWKNRAIARKSLVVERATKLGEPLSLVCKRPGSGVSPFEFWTRNTSPAQRVYDENELVDE